MPEKIVTEIAAVGFKHHMKKPEREALANTARARKVAVTLQREPDNRFDSNAIKIVRKSDNAFLGYVPADSAAVVAPKLDAGKVRIDAAKLTAVDVAADTGTMEVTLTKL